jgi:PAS domain-containing protein
MAIALRHMRAATPATRHSDSPLGNGTRPPLASWRVWVERALEALTPVLLVVEAGYGSALIAVGAATAAALVLHLGSEPGVFAPFLVAVFATALRDGIGPALAAIALSMIVTYFGFLAPMVHLAFDPAALRRLALFRIGVFAGSGLLATLIAEVHRQRLHQLEHGRDQLRAFTTNDAIGLQTIDHYGRIAWADGTTARLLGYDDGAYVGQPFARFHADVALAAEIQDRLAAGLAVENRRATLRRQDGTTQDVLLTSNTLLGDGRTPGTRVLVAILPVKTVEPLRDEGEFDFAALMERRRKAAAERSASSRLS